VSNTSFNKQLNNITDEVVRDDLQGTNHQLVISPVKERVPDVSSIMAAPDAL